MKTIKSILWISVASLVLLLFIVEQQNKNHKLTDSPSKKDWQEPNDWFFNQRAYPSTNIDLKSYTKAKQQVLEMRKTKQNPLEFEYVEVPNISGRVVDIEMFDGDENKILVGTASGGVFVTENNGISWEAITDDIQSLSIGDIAIAPSNQDILYVGTGEPNAGGGSLAYDGTGIYKSLDQGETWNPTNLDYNGSISRIVVDSENPDIAYAGLMGRLFQNDSERGLYRTIDGGDTWEKTLYIDDSTGVIDIVMDPFDNSTLYCATWTRVRRPSFRDYGGIGSGIYKSTDGGISWSLLSNFPNNTENLGRIGLAISKSSSPAKLYAIYSSGDGPLLGFSSSEDGGENWIEHNIGK